MAWTPHDERTGIITTASMLILASPLLAQEPPEPPPPDVMFLTGTVRDFKEKTAAGGHPDFENRPAHGFAHYMGNISRFLDPDGKPVYTGGGFMVADEWLDADGHPIAGHLICTAPDYPSLSVILQDSNDVDAFEISIVNVTYNGDGTSTWTYHVRELPGGKDLSHWCLSLEPSHVLETGTTPGYSLGVDGSTGFYGIKWDVEESFSESDFTVVLNQHYEGAESDVGALAKGGNQADQDLMYVPIVQVHCDSPEDGVPGAVYAPMPGDVPGSEGYADNGGITSSESFAQWYRNVPGVNISAPLTIALVEQEDGTFVFDDTLDPEYMSRGGFFPIDHQLFGNSDSVYNHNYHFTYEIHATFTYDADADQHFSFTGDDDVWVFVDKKLVIDLGGVHGPVEQYVDLHRLGLEDGHEYDLHFFFAERHRTQSNFRIVTNLSLTSPDKPSVTVACD